MPDLPDGLGIIGRERALIDRLAQRLLDAAKRHYDYTEVKQERRGATFQVELDDPTGYFENRSARVTIELLPFKAAEAKAS